MLLLARHFDQQLEDFQVVQNDLIAFMRSNGIATTENYKPRMSSREIHLMLKSKLEALSYVGGINVFDADGILINASSAWPVPSVSVADRAYFKTFKSDPRSPDQLVEPVFSRITGAWTTVIARKIAGPNGRIPRRHQPWHRARELRKILRHPGARTGRHRCDASPRRHPSCPISAHRCDDREEFQPWPGQRPPGIRARPQHVAPDQSNRRQRPTDLFTYIGQVSHRDRGDHEDIGGAGRLARADQHPDRGRHGLRACDRRLAVSRGAQAVATAPPNATAADA